MQKKGCVRSWGEALTKSGVGFVGAGFLLGKPRALPPGRGGKDHRRDTGRRGRNATHTTPESVGATGPTVGPLTGGRRPPRGRCYTAAAARWRTGCPSGPADDGNGATSWAHGLGCGRNKGNLGVPFVKDHGPGLRWAKALRERRATTRHSSRPPLQYGVSVPKS